MVAGGGGAGDGQMVIGEWEIQASRYGMNKSGEERVQHKNSTHWYWNSVAW